MWPLFIRTSTDGIYNPTGMIYWQALNEEGQEMTSGNIPLTAEEVEAWGLEQLSKTWQNVQIITKT